MEDELKFFKYFHSFLNIVILDKKKNERKIESECEWVKETVRDREWGQRDLYRKRQSEWLGDWCREIQIERGRDRERGSDRGRLTEREKEIQWEGEKDKQRERREEKMHLRALNDPDIVCADVHFLFFLAVSSEIIKFLPSAYYLCK